MITYREKGKWLHKAIRDAGYSLEQVDGVWAADNPVEVQRIIDEFDQTPFLEKEATDEKLTARAEKLKSLTVTTSTGKVFDASDEARQNMADAIQASTFMGQTETYWKLADNTVAVVTLKEVREAHALAIQEKGKLILGGG
jgi:hypothetical protein